MKKNFLFGLLALVLAWAWFGGISMAEDGAVARIGETNNCTTVEEGNGCYATLADAINAAGTNVTTITLLKDTSEDVFIPENAKITLNLGLKKLTNESNHTITNEWTLTIEWEWTVDNVTHAKAAIYNSPKWNATLNWWTFTRSQEAGSTPENSNGNSYYTIENHWIMKINEWVTVYNKGHFSSMLHNWYYDWSKKWDNISPELTINWWHFDWWIKTVKNDDFGILTINWWTYTNNTQWCVLNWNTATINWWTFNPSDTYAIELGYKDEPNDAAKLTINWGTFNWGFRYNTPGKTDHEVSIMWWKFTEDVTKYTAEWYYSIYDWEEYYEVTSEIWTLTSFYMSSNAPYNNTKFEVILNEAWTSIDLWKTKAYLNKKLSEAEKTLSKLYQWLKDKTDTDWIEVIEVEWEKLLFINNTINHRTDVFRSSTTWKFSVWTEFVPTQSTKYPSEWLVYGKNENEVKAPTWVNTSLTPTKYNAIKDWEVIIWYTLLTDWWFYAPKAFNVTFVDEDWVTSLSDAQIITLNWKATKPATDPTKEWFIFDGWFKWEETTAFDFENTTITENTELKAHWSTAYTITLNSVSNWTISSDKATAKEWDTITLTATPNTNYNFTSWTVKNWDVDVTVTNNTFTMPASNVTVSATFTSKPASYSWGGGSSRSSSTTTTKKDDTKKAEDTKAEETKADETKTDESKTEENKVDGNNNDSVAPATFSQEFQDAYEFAYKNGITTMDSIEKADMYWPLTRVAMAKMLSQYAINVLGKEPDTTKVVPTFSDVDAKLDADYNNWITLAYQLWIMWIGINKYRPFDLVTRAEFGTALSRMLFGLEDGEWNEWYSTHLAKLMEEQIITNNNPNLQELRGYVMIMLMRSAQ